MRTWARERSCSVGAGDLNMHRKDVRSSQGGPLALTRGEGCGVPGPLPLQACGGLLSPQALAPFSPTWGRGGYRPHRSRPRGGGWWPDGLVAPADGRAPRARL